jgi:hypothetical protein
VLTGAAAQLSHSRRHLQPPGARTRDLSKKAIAAAQPFTSSGFAKILAPGWRWLYGRAPDLVERLLTPLLATLTTPALLKALAHCD